MEKLVGMCRQEPSPVIRSNEINTWAIFIHSFIGLQYNFPIDCRKCRRWHPPKWYAVSQGGKQAGCVRTD